MRLVVLRPVFALCVVLASAVPAAAFVRFDVQEELVDSVRNPQAVALADFNGDSIEDAAVVDVADLVVVFLNDGAGVLEEDASYDTGEAPVAVATGLFNADAFVDIVVVNSLVGSVSIFYNDGEGIFDDEDPRQFLADADAMGVAVADFNNDGEDDLAVLSPSRIALLQGNGDGTFSAFNPATIETRSSDSFAIAAGNLDAGINIDLAVTNRANGEVAIFLGAGDGTFVFSGLPDAGPAPEGLVIVDPTNDGINDLVCALSEGLTTTEMSLLENDGEGVFDMAVQFTGPEFPTAITALDVEPNNQIDLAITSSEGGEIFILCQPSEVCPGSAVEAGIWAEAIGGSVRGCADGVQVAIASGKLNDDTRDDFVALKANQDGDIDTLCVALNQSAPGTPMPMPTTPGGGPTATPSGPTNTPTITPPPTPTATPTLIPTVGLGVCNTKDDASKFPTLERPVAVAIGDFNRNGVDDVAVADINADQVFVILETFGAPNPSMPCTPINVSQIIEVPVSDPEALVAADLDRDGSIDLAVIGNGGLYVFYGSGSGLFVPSTANPMSAGIDPSAIALADLNRDFTPDLIVTDSGSSNVSIFMGTRQRPAPFVGPCAMPVQGRTNAAVSTDLNNDGRNDFAVTSPQSRTVGVFLQVASAQLACGNMAASFQGQTALGLPGDPIGLLAGTFGLGDAIPDLVVAMTKQNASGTVLLFEGRIAGSGVTYQPGTDTAVPVPTPNGTPVVPAVPSAIGRGDIERDGRTDLLITDTGNNTLAQFRGQPSGGLGVPLIPTNVMGDGPVALAVADLDGDGRDDVVVANADDGSLSYMLSDQRAPTPTPTNTIPPTPTNTQVTPGTPTETPSITPTATRSRRPSLTPTPVATNTQRGVVTLNGNGCAIDEDGNSLDSLILAAFALVPWLMRRQALNSQG